MISYNEILSAVKNRPVPTPVPTPTPPVQKQTTPSVNPFQNVFNTAKNFIGGLTKDPSSIGRFALNPVREITERASRPLVKKGYDTLVAKGSPIDVTLKGKFSEIPKAFSQVGENYNKQQALIGSGYEKFKKGIPQTPEELAASKNQLFSVVGSVDAGVGRLFPKPGAAKVEQKVAQNVVRDVKPIAPPAGGSGPETDLITKVTNALKQAKPVQKKQQELYSKELIERSAKVAEVGKTLTGEEAHRAQLSALKGELAPKSSFTPIRETLTPQEVGTLKDTIEANTVLRPLEKVDAKSALDDLLDGVAPQRAEIQKLETVFGKDFSKTATQKTMTGIDKFVQKVGDVLNVPRALNSSMDLSAAGRQGVFAIPSHPVAAAKSFVKQFKAVASDKGYNEVMAEIQKRPGFKIARDAGVAFTDTSGILSGKEEAYMSNLAEKIPIIGKLVRASDRGYSSFLNDFRSQLWEGFYKNADKLGKGNDLKTLKNFAGLVNNMTGRGDLGVLNRYAPVLNGAFFSPRLMASRVQLMNPVYYKRLEPAVRKEAIKSLVAFVGTGLSILGMAGAAGAEVGIDPRSADFGKIKVGNTRYDIWGGFQQYAVLLSRLYLNESVSTTTGKVNKFGEGYKPTTRREILGRFFESKLAPVPSIGNDILKGTTQLGEPVTVPGEAYSRLTPFFIQDFLDTTKEQGLPLGALMSVPGFFGIGGNTYSPTTSKKTTSKFKVGPSVLR